MSAPVVLPVYHCRKIPGPLTLDGSLRESVWQETPAIQLTLTPGQGAPRQATLVRGCWDGATVYLAFDCQDVDVRASMTQRDDRVWQEEAVEAFIAPYGDLVHYFEFQCNPLNTVNDVRVTNTNARAGTTTFDRAWTCAGWQTVTRVDGRVNSPASAISSPAHAEGAGWHSEWAIPLASLLEPGAEPVLSGEEWRVNLFRIDRWPAEEYSAWSPNPLSPISFHRPTYFGRWVFG